MWIAKKGAQTAAPPARKAPAQKPSAPALKAVAAPEPSRQLHVPHHVETEISNLLIQRGRLEMRIGKHLLHFVNMTRNNDGSVDYVVRTRMHTHNGMQRNFESVVRIFENLPPKLVR